jgi:two-component system, NtrC family, nitrogen regulation sensor histidine kinase NtrY
MSRSASLFALGIALRATLLAGIAFAVIELLATRRLYVTALLVAGAGAGVLADLVRHITQGERMLERFVTGLNAGSCEPPAPAGAPLTGFRDLRLAIKAAAQTLDAARVARQQEVDYLQTLIDNVSVALVVLHDDGSVTLANSAARRLARLEANRLDQVLTIGSTAAATLTRMAPGERAVVRLAGGQRVLALSARFSAGIITRRLLSLQNIEGELDGVELKAWQDVLRVLAHEIMNSLTPISTLAESVRPLVTDLRDGSGKQQDVADAIDAIARRSAGLVSFIGRYRTLAELPPPVRKEVRIGDLVRRIDQLMSSTLSEKGIEYSSHVEPAELAINADRELIEQLLVNLLTNAIEACSDTDRPCIRVSCDLREDTVAVSVADNGRGLDASAIERIFVPLFTTKSGGSGIGLSLARQIAHAHGGKLQASANVPRGAVFTLQLPVHSAPAAARPTIEAP